MFRKAAFLIIALVVALPPSTGADTVDHPVAFTVAFRGLNVADITGTARETEDAYAAALRMRATGLGAAFAQVRFDMRVEGFREGSMLRPFRYSDTFDSGERQGAVELRWPGGIGPELLSEPPQVEPDVTPVTAAEAVGAEDRLTILWRMARPQPEDALCNWQTTMFDGARLASFAIAPPEINGNTATCAGLYTRLAGFPEDDLTNNARFPFVLSYTQTSLGVWELTEANGQSILGPVRIYRRT